MIGTGAIPGVDLLTGDAAAVLATMAAGSVQCVVTRDDHGRFIQGVGASPATQFKVGDPHWRTPQVFRERAYLLAEYVGKQRSTGDLATEHGCTCAAIRFWLKRHDISRRSIAQARAVKHWGAVGERNPMFGKRGPASSSWKGGITAERQAFYNSREWKAIALVVRKRDGGMCRRCADRPVGRGATHLHHIVGFAVAALRADPDNLITLCKPCHLWVHSAANTAHEFIREHGEEV